MIQSVPDYIIIGAQKCGTTALQRYIGNHPFVCNPSRKELNFFDNSYHKGIDWYISQFPVMSKRRHFITGEASPYYLFKPGVAEKIAGFKNNMKLIVILRNPVDRAYSQYWHEVRRGRIETSFEDHIVKELHFQEEGKHEFGATSMETIHRRYLLLARGRYAEQLERWFKHFQKDQFLFLQMLHLYKNPERTMQSVFNFLGLDFYSSLFERLPDKTASYPPLSSETWIKLNSFYAEHNLRLHHLTGINFIE
jgi:hypothetical protein